METNTCPKTWLTESILVTIFCCLPFGIIGIINAYKVSSLYAQEKYAEAELRSANAEKWVKISFFVGLVCGIISFIINFLHLF